MLGSLHSTATPSGAPLHIVVPLLTLTLTFPEETSLAKAEALSTFGSLAMRVVYTSSLNATCCRSCSLVCWSNSAQPAALRSSDCIAFSLV